MSADVIPSEPTERDFSRLGAIVTLERYRVDPEALWAPEEVTARLWDCRDIMPFRSLAMWATEIARNTRIKTPGAIYLAAAGVIEL